MRRFAEGRRRRVVLTARDAAGNESFVVARASRRGAAGAVRALTVPAVASRPRPRRDRRRVAWCAPPRVRVTLRARAAASAAAVVGLGRRRSPPRGSARRCAARPSPRQAAGVPAAPSRCSGLRPGLYRLEVSAAERGTTLGRLHICAAGSRSANPVRRPSDAAAAISKLPAPCPLLEAIVLGIAQGLTEFLPISSTAHLRIVPAFAGWEDPGALFTAVIQLGHDGGGRHLLLARPACAIARHVAGQPAPAGAARRARRPHGLVRHHRDDPDRRSSGWRSRTRSRTGRATST